MAISSAESRATLSVLDRLIDEDPGNPDEAPMSRADSVRRVKISLRRDLEWLLNTRRIAVDPPPELREVAHSLYTFGLPDLSSFSLSVEKERVRLLKTLHGAIRIFESRLANVRVVATDTADPSRSRVSFRIDAVLMMDPAPERISFDTVLELSNGGYKIRGDIDAG
jgi:type VI secretion system protein ImpF